MKKIFFYAATSLLVAGCASDEIVDVLDAGQTGKSKEIHFTTNQKNITRATALNQAGHYNFGVFGYKSTDVVNPVMDNYLVGYYDQTNGYDTQAGTTVGDPTSEVNGQSYWMYEGMGYEEYLGKFAGKDLTNEYKSNNAKQYLKYWDLAAATTTFYAYAPYINGNGTATYVDGQAVAGSADTYVLTIPNGTMQATTIEEGEDYSLYEYMYAATKVAKANYSIDVPLNFTRLNAKVNIKFWEDIPGYKVRILDLGGNRNYEGVQAAAAIYTEANHGDATYGYTAGKFYLSNGAKIQFNSDAQGTVKQFAGTTGNNTNTITFKAPTADQIGESRLTASPSTTTYFAIPKGQGNVLSADATDYSATTSAEATGISTTGFTFHVSYELTAEDTGERIVVRNATVHVPYTYCNWAPNTRYTYIFKITKNSNGTTAPDVDPGTGTTPDTDVDPTSPVVPTEQGLYPIVFDNCTVVDWTDNESEHEITNGTGLTYYSVKLNKYSMTNSQDNDLTVTVARTSTHLGNANLTGADAAVTVAGPTGYTAAKIDVTTTPGHIIVKEGATIGTYTVTWNVPTADIDANHPRSYTTTFTVGNAYTIRTVQGSSDLNEVGTGGTAAAKLAIKTTKNNTDETTSEGTYSIEYLPTTAPSAAEQAKVKINSDNVIEVANNANPGTYVLAYTVGGAVVARHEFEVKKYNVALNTTLVGLNSTNQEVTVSVNNLGTLTGKITAVSPTDTKVVLATDGSKVTVSNGAAEGTYTVTYTINTGLSSVISYTKTFVVTKTYAVTIDGTPELNVMTGAAGGAAYGDQDLKFTYAVDGVTITTGAKTGLSILDPAGSALTEATYYTATDAETQGATPTKNVGDVKVANDYTLTYTSSKYVLKLNSTLAAGQYKIKFTDTNSKSADAEFRVVK